MTARMPAAGAQGSAAEPALPPEVVSRAVDWLVQLWSGTATEDTHAQCQAWRAQHPLHERAWQQIESTNARLRGPGALSGALAATTLARSRQAQATRRRTLAGLVGLGFVGTAAWTAHQRLPWQAWNADVRTARGEQRQMQLPDGTQLLLNTATAIDLRYSGELRCVRLLQGEMLITTAPDTALPARPFVVDTPAGRIRALGTRFTVRHEADSAGASASTQVAVFEGAVQLRGQAGATVRVDAGQAARLDASGAWLTGGAGEAPGWVQGVLVASDMRLDAFVAELRRYRSGLITLAPEVAGLRLSGVFPLADTDRILQSLVQVLPVSVHVPLRHWVRIGPAAPGPARAAGTGP